MLQKLDFSNATEVHKKNNPKAIINTMNTSTTTRPVLYIN